MGGGPNTGEESASDIPLDVCALMLADLDERSYQRSLMRDANALLERIVLPIAFPWEHRIVPVARNLPYDIDEMTEVLTADDGTYAPFENGPFDYGRYDIGQMRIGSSTARVQHVNGGVCAATRRSHDPGVVEYRAITFPPKESLPGNGSKSPSTLSEKPWRTWDQEDGPIYGEAALRAYQVVRQNKRRRMDRSKGLLNSKLISVKVSSSSSRASVFSRFEKLRNVGLQPVVMNALLPTEVHTGKTLTVARTIPIVMKLGTYDCRHGSTANPQVGKGISRITAGRTRLIWSAKGTGEFPQKMNYFRSLLTGEKLEAGSHKRPREIKVAVKVDGSYLVSVSDGVLQPNQPDESSEPDAPRSSEDDTQDEARLRFWNPSDKVSAPRLQCSLNPKAFISKVFEWKGSEAAQESSSTGSSVRKPPVLECIPDYTGQLSVVCSNSGQINLGTSIQNYLSSTIGQTERICMICLLSESSSIGQIQKCFGCQITVHEGCCSSIGTLRDNLWFCEVCTHTSNTERPRRCTACPHDGGPLTRTDDGGGGGRLIHEICQTWNPPSPKFLQSASHIKCALCGWDPPEPSPRALVKCAAARCQVWFHPMCAFLTNIEVGKTLTKVEVKEEAKEKEEPYAVPSAVSSGGPNGIERSTTTGGDDDDDDDDKRLCEQFTLTGMNYTATVGSLGKDPGARRFGLISVCFCGFHNPKRKQQMFGMYPHGKFLTPETMRIPPSRG